MSSPKDGKNIMRTPKEKEDIVLEYLDGRISTRAIAAKYGTTQGVFNKWLKRYRENGIKGLESKTGKHSNPNAGKYNRHPSELEKIQKQLLEKEIEIMRLKKGYQVKGVGAKKEYVTIFDVNMK